MTDGDVFRQVLKERRSAFGPKNTSEKLQQDMEEDPNVRFQKKMARLQGVIDRTGQTNG